MILVIFEKKFYKTIVYARTMNYSRETATATVETWARLFRVLYLEKLFQKERNAVALMLRYLLAQPSKVSLNENRRLKRPKRK